MILSEKIEGGATSGFDYLRLILATAVLTWHTYPLTHGEVAAAQFMSGWGGPLVRLILPMFFALSGFLVASSYERNSLGTFLIFRGLRIVPALAVEVALSALILGPLLTTYTLEQYLSDGRLAKYFLNVIGLIHYQLPGLFDANPYPNVVNGSLWTVPFELECYIGLVILALLTIMRRPLILLALISLGGMALLMISGLRQVPDLTIDSAVPGRALILCFFAGALIYIIRDKIPYSAPLCIASLIVSCGFLCVPSLYVFSPLPAAYATVWLGLQNVRKLPIIFSGDYSYGVYLYAFPMQQTTVYLLGTGFWSTLIVSLMVTFCFAVFSWWFIERPTLKLKRYFASGGKRTAHQHAV